MTVTPVVGRPHAAFAVLPVIDCEPPACDIARCPPSSHAPSRAPGPRGLRTRHSSGAAAESATVPLSPQMRQAAAFADAALRRVLEVIDRRRPAIALRAVLAPNLIDAVLSVSRTVDGQCGAAVLRRMRVQPAGCAATGRAAEVFGAYGRGDRIHAIACRVEQAPGPARARWMMVALHIG